MSCRTASRGPSSVVIFWARVDRPSRADTERELVARLTQAVVDVLGEPIRDQTWVVLTGVPPGRWGIAGTPGTSGPQPGAPADIPPSSQSRAHLKS